MNETVKRHMDWIQRLVERPRIHLGGMEQAVDGLVKYFEEIIRTKDAKRAREVRSSMAQYAELIAKCRGRGAGFMLAPLDWRLDVLDDLADKAGEERAPRLAGATGGVTVAAGPVSVALPEAHWSVRRPIEGTLTFVPDNVGVRDLLPLRRGAAGTVIYLMESRPTVIDLAGWPDRNSYVVSAEGGATSEEMNFAMSEGRPYVNGARQYFDALKRLSGRQVVLLPTENAPAARRAAVAWSSPTGDESLTPAEYIDSILTHPTNREMAYAFLAWGLEGSEAVRGAREQLRRLITDAQYERRVREGRGIPPKEYPPGYKLKTVSEIVRALARFATAREEGRLDYAQAVAEAFPYEPLSRLLKGVLADGKGAPRRSFFFRKKR